MNVRSFEVGIQIVNAAEITRLNEEFLQHAGPTDVITFDYAGAAQKQGAAFIFGDIYVCIEEAIRQAKSFRTSWQQELVRYIIHGILHLLGYDDHTPRQRQRMKRIENSLVKAVSTSISVSALELRRRKTHG